MKSMYRAFLAVFTVLATALPASAQGTTDAPSLIYVWAWILIAGVIVFVVGTCLGVSSGKK
jgi:hypothetical protein